jgi:hypothetical protein
VIEPFFFGAVCLVAVLVAAPILLRVARRVRHRFDASRDRAWREERRRAHPVPPSPITSPLEIVGRDERLSPITGLSRLSWDGIARQMLEGLLHYTNGLRERIRPPVSFVSNYPRLERGGRVYGIEEEHLEAFCRSLWMAGPVLSRDPGMRMHGRSVADYYRERLVRGATPGDPDALGVGRGPHPTPHIMEAAAVCIALRQYRSVLWDPLAPKDRARIASWLDAVRARPVNTNNWRWFSVIVETFLKTEGYAHDAARVRDHLEAIRAFHVDAGWSRDLDKFDYYSAWSLQFYPVFWALWDGDSNPTLRDEFAERSDRFLAGFVHLFSRQGTIPLWGRSPIYRFGAAVPLAAAFLRSPIPAVDPGFARRLASGALLQFVARPGFLRDGIPSLGWLEERPEIVDHYSGVASPYWCAKLFCALSLPEQSPFWTATENVGYWNNPPERYDIGHTGMWVTHDVRSGHSRLHAPQTAAPKDPRYQAPYFDTADAS